MARVADVVGLASATCALAALVLSLPGVAWLRRRSPLLAPVAALALPLFPIAGLLAAGYLRGVIGDLSVTTTLLLLYHLLRPMLRLPAIGERSRLALQALVATGGALLYPLTLGFSAFDPYRLGFAHMGFVGALLVLSLGAWLARLQLVACCLAVAVLAWAMGGLESRNLWDYLLDPLLVAWGLGAFVSRLAGGLRARPRFGYPSDREGQPCASPGPSR